MFIDLLLLFCWKMFLHFQIHNIGIQADELADAWVWGKGAWVAYRESVTPSMCADLWRGGEVA